MLDFFFEGEPYAKMFLTLFSVSTLDPLYTATSHWNIGVYVPFSFFYCHVHSLIGILFCFDNICVFFVLLAEVLSLYSEKIILHKILFYISLSLF